MVVVMSISVVIVEPKLLSPMMSRRNGADEAVDWVVVALVTDIWVVVGEADEDKVCPGEGTVELLGLEDTKTCDVADTDEELVNIEIVLFEDGCEMTLLESDDPSVYIDLVDEVPVMVDVTVLHRLFPAED